MTRLSLALLALATAVWITACEQTGQSRTFRLATLNDSGVTGTVTLTDVGSDRTRVEIKAAAAGYPDMPAHIHPGTCAELIPQPKFPLANVVDGTSMTVVPATLAELTRDALAVNLHASNDDLKTYTACVELE